jgi:D-proline reductase (dithiol) PrdB
MRGLSTVLITVSPAASRQMRPPRALYPKEFKIGNATGHPGMPELQQKVVRDALLLIKAPPTPGEIIEREYPEY